MTTPQDYDILLHTNSRYGNSKLRQHRVLIKENACKFPEHEKVQLFITETNLTASNYLTVKLVIIIVFFPRLDYQYTMLSGISDHLIHRL